MRRKRCPSRVHSPGSGWGVREGWCHFCACECTTKQAGEYSVSAINRSKVLCFKMSMYVIRSPNVS